MIQATVDRKAFLDVCETLSEETVDAIVMTYPDVFRSAVLFGTVGDVPAKPAAKPRERKPRSVPQGAAEAVLAAVNAGADTTQAIMSKAGITRSATSAALATLVDAGALVPVGKGRGTKYAVAGAAS